MILHGIEYQRPTSLNMRILADHVTYSFLAFMKSIFHFCLGCYCGGYSQNGRSNLSSYWWVSLLELIIMAVCFMTVFPCSVQTPTLMRWVFDMETGLSFLSVIIPYFRYLYNVMQLLGTSLRKWGLYVCRAVCSELCGSPSHVLLCKPEKK